MEGGEDMFGCALSTAPITSTNVDPTTGRIPRTRTSIVSPFSLQVSTLSPTSYRREDLEDLLADPAYFQAVFHSLDRVRSLYQSQSELGLANESIASMCYLAFDCIVDIYHITW